VSVFPPNSTKATAFLSLPGNVPPEYVTVDSSGNLFVSSDNGTVFEFPSGSGPAKNLNLLGLAGSGGIAFDGSGHLLVADVFNDTVNVYDPPAAKPIRQLNVGVEPSSIAFTKNYTALFVTAYSSGKVYSIAYATGKVTPIPQPGSGFASSALSPAAYP
jgi:DNA-binding beta-propeller fold protein YncE